MLAPASCNGAERRPGGCGLLNRGADRDRQINARDVVVQAVSLPAGDPAVLTSDICRSGLAYWRRLEFDGRLPDRAAIDPADMRALLPYTFMVDVLAGGDEFRYRLIGTNIVAHTPRDNTGMRLSEIDGQGTQAQLRALYASVAAGGGPRFQRIAYRTRSGLRSWYETVVCPMLDRATGPGAILLIGWAEHFHQPIDQSGNP